MLGLQPVDDDIGHLLGLQHGARRGDHAGGQPQVVGGIVGHLGHARAHAHRAQAAHPQAAVAVGDRQPFGERDRGVLGHRVGHGADLRQQAGGLNAVVRK